MSGGRVSSKAGGRLLALSLIVLGAALALFGSADRAGAADRRASSSGVFVSEMNDVQRVRVTVNKSRTFRVDTAFSTIVAGSPDIVDVKSLSDHLIYIQGKQTGTTNVILFDSSMKQIGILDVEVAIDIGNLQQNIQSSTGTRGIRVSAAEGQVVLSGTAVDAVAAERAMAIATGSVPKGAVVVNAMNVASPQQVMLEVRFLEVDRTAGRQLGVNLFGGNGNGTQVVNTGLGAITRCRGARKAYPSIGTAGTLVGTAGGAAIGGAVPFGNILYERPEAQQWHLARRAGHGAGDQRVGAPAGRAESDRAFRRFRAVPCRWRIPGAGGVHTGCRRGPSDGNDRVQEVRC